MEWNWPMRESLYTKGRRAGGVGLLKHSGAKSIALQALMLDMGLLDLLDFAFA